MAIEKRIGCGIGLIIKALSEHKMLTKQEITKLLITKLPDILSIKQKHSKIQNLLTKLRKLGKIENESRGVHSNWHLIQTQFKRNALIINR